MRSTKTRNLLAATLAFALALPAAAAPVKISALPSASAVSATDVFPVTQGTCPGSCATNGATGAQLKTWVEASPTLTTPQLGVATVTTLGGKNAITSITLGATGQVGSGATAVCAASHACTSLSGEITLTTGTGSLTAGTLFTINFADTRANAPNCALSPAQGGGTVKSVVWSETTATAAVTGVVALVASTAYTVDYVCGGN
jgi:hypothetical protein